MLSMAVLYGYLASLILSSASRAAPAEVRHASQHADSAYPFCIARDGEKRYAESVRDTCRSSPEHDTGAPYPNQESEDTVVLKIH